MFASVYVLTFLFRGAGVVAPEASALAVAACASRTLFAGKHLNFTVRRSGAILPRNPPRTFHQLLLFCSVASPAPPVLAARESSRSAPAFLRRDGGQHPPRPS